MSDDSRAHIIAELTNFKSQLKDLTVEERADAALKTIYVIRNSLNMVGQTNAVSDYNDGFAAAMRTVRQLLDGFERALKQ